jgi:hypothetical protein
MAAASVGASGPSVAVRPASGTCVTLVTTMKNLVVGRLRWCDGGRIDSLETSA